ncbi:MAG: carboxylating nicotinate-nucleotide diphosphorylase [Nitrospina sp.]|jgi:nicotinate-nucleotide pyrophosphorylase (carboxylating)|nr:carboxylating nicotinate-nucleotide diphosphorylase [Nitrospina sp.]MBT3875922.1 carboxylating nicotinate-nucleotide diphosphorylase [Nitrospina sp.]MBT4046943.1 carboxylating nicotinate-nucleotide diphosphorylase [Nitrospina sp.]MBT4557337.1 carboxylating nicotinate-nucleotide diphosphorylase [Nitrospina sp.]MBT5347609.1 carboxylating nicotinate-nucleotide diphosphorylase [Nitrospina sp.]
MPNKILLSADIESLIDTTLKEDIQTGDITTRNIISPGQVCESELIAKEDLVLSGIEIFKTLFRKLDLQTQFLFEPFKDGDRVPKGSSLLKFQCDSIKALEGERSGLNILQWLSGIATLTRKFVDKASPVKVLDTRKTTPGLRVFEKYAVACGGGTNHRFGLYDAVMIKDNHIKSAGSIFRAVEKVREGLGLKSKIEVETQNLDEVNEALENHAHIIMLDNMSIEMIHESIKLINGQAKVEISGCVTLDRLDELSKTGADFVSVGALTHSAPSVDISMNIISA